MSTGPAGRRQGRRDDTAPTCGQLLQRYRSLAGITQEGLAERAGYSADYIGKLERDQRELPIAALDRLSLVLDLGEQERAALRAARDRASQPGAPAGLLVGREAEQRDIYRLLAGIGPPVLLFAAEPGMGKTRLLEEAAAAGARSGWEVALGGCQRRAQEPYAPLSAAVADALRHLPAADQDEVRGELQPDQQRRRLFTAAERCLRAAAGKAGILLVLDDLHWAGPDGLDLLTALMTATGSPPIRLIGAYRDSETPDRLDEFTTDLARASRVRVRALAPLSDAEAERLLARLVPAAPQVLPAVVRRAGGVPFFLVSYAEELRDSGHDGPASTVPWTVAKVIRQRVLTLPGPAQELLEVAAVVGPVVPHRLLAQVSGSGDEQVLAAVEAALAARLLTEDGQADYCFSHDLIRETIEHG